MSNVYNRKSLLINCFILYWLKNIWVMIKFPFNNNIQLYLHKVNIWVKMVHRYLNWWNFGATAKWWTGSLFMAINCSKPHWKFYNNQNLRNIKKLQNFKMLYLLFSNNCKHILRKGENSTCPGRNWLKL